MSAKCTCGHLLESHAAGGWCNARFGGKRGRYCACETFESNRPAPSPDAPGQREADAGGEVELERQAEDPTEPTPDVEREVEALARDICVDHDETVGGALAGEDVPCAGCLYDARVVLRSPWLAAHDASVVAAARADAEGRLGEVRRDAACADRCLLMTRAVEDTEHRLPWLDELDGEA